MTVYQERIAIDKYVVALTFSATNVPDAAGNAVSIESGTNDYVAPYNGSVVAISANQNAELTTGVVTFRPTIDGTADTNLTTSVQNGTQTNYAVTDGRVIQFTAGSKIGVDFTKSGTVDPVTTDVAITLWLLVEGVQL
jgi:hypothetical protein